MPRTPLQPSAALVLFHLIIVCVPREAFLAPQPPLATYDPSRRLPANDAQSRYWLPLRKNALTFHDRKQVTCPQGLLGGPRFHLFDEAGD